MSLNDAHSRIKARVWKAVAQAELDLSELPKDDIEHLVDIVTEAALLEIDSEIGQSLTKSQQTDDETESLVDDEHGEEILWQGRPLLSISKQYIVTNERIRIIEGLMGKDREDIELIRVQDLDQTQSLGERILNIGDINIRSHDTSHPEVILNNIKDPQGVHEILRRAVLKAREKYRLHYREEM